MKATIPYIERKFDEFNQRNSRIEEEKAVVDQIVRLYCRKHEGNTKLCPNCKQLLDFAFCRFDN